MRLLLIVLAITGTLLLGVPWLGCIPQAPVAPRAEWVPGELIVKLGGDLNLQQPDLQDFLRQLGATLPPRTFFFNGAFLIELSGDMQEVRRSIEADPRFEYAVPNHIVRLASTITPPNDPFFKDQWALHSATDEDIDAPEAWTTATGCEEEVVAVIDSGIHEDPDLELNRWKNPCEDHADNGLDDACTGEAPNGKVDDYVGWDFVDDDNDVTGSYRHGTQVAGIIGAEVGNDHGIAGVTPRVSMMILRVFAVQSSPLERLAKAIEYAVENGADIINASWGTYELNTHLREEVDYALENGVFIVAAAGNDNRDAQDHPYYPASFSHENVIAVAATTTTGDLHPSSNYGAKQVDLGAPGERIWATDAEASVGASIGHQTSVAAPFVTGTAALVKCKYPEIGLGDMRARLLSGDKKPALDGRPAARLSGVLVHQSLIPIRRSLSVSGGGWLGNLQRVSSCPRLAVEIGEMHGCVASPLRISIRPSSETTRATA